MLITHYAIIKLQRDDKRQWTILGQCNDIPGECRPSLIYPIVSMIDPEDGNLKKIPRTHGYGWIDPAEQFGYIKMNFYKRGPGAEEAEAVDNVVVEFVRGRR
jgi:hypothetical protein